MEALEGLPTWVCIAFSMVKDFVTTWLSNAKMQMSYTFLFIMKIRFKFSAVEALCLLLVHFKSAGNLNNLVMI